MVLSGPGGPNEHMGPYIDVSVLLLQLFFIYSKLQCDLLNIISIIGVYRVFNPPGAIKKIYYS